MSPSDLGPEGLENPFTLFAYLVPTGGKVLLSGTEAKSALIRLGYLVDETEKDLRLLSVPPESLDAIWWDDANTKYSVEDAFRVFQTFFRGLRPKKGVLVFSFSLEKQAITNKHHAWNTRTVMTLLRQSGLELVHTFESKTGHLYFCQRL
jgi:hypothetical protein